MQTLSWDAFFFFGWEYFQNKRHKLCVLETYISDHLPSGLISFSVVGPFLFLLQNPLPGCPIFQCKFTDDPAELVYIHFPYCIRRMAHKEQKGMEPAMRTKTGNYLKTRINGLTIFSKKQISQRQTSLPLELGL